MPGHLDPEPGVGHDPVPLEPQRQHAGDQQQAEGVFADLGEGLDDLEQQAALLGRGGAGSLGPTDRHQHQIGAAGDEGDDADEENQKCDNVHGVVPPQCPGMTTLAQAGASH